MNDAAVSRSMLVEQLRELGVKPGAILLVHTSFREVRPVEGGPEVLIEALRKALDPNGTLIMPSMSDDDDHSFDPATTPCFGMGIVADTFWRHPASYAATARTPSLPLGRKRLASPRLIPSTCRTASTAPSAACTNWMAGCCSSASLTTQTRRSTSLRTWPACATGDPNTWTILKDGKPARFYYAEIDHCCENFEQVGQWLTEKALQRIAPIGHGEARLMRSRDIVQEVTARLRANEMTFLHEPGVDDQCDEARASIPISTSTSSRSS